MMDFRLAQDTTEDRLAFMTLSNSLYERKVNEAYVSWQFFAPPFPSYLTFACDGERVVGAYALHQTGGPSGDMAMALDIMIAADYQGRGLIKPLGEAAFTFARQGGVKRFCVVANERACAAHRKYFGWEIWKTLVDWDYTPNTHKNSDLVCNKKPWPELALLAECCALINDVTIYPRSAKILDWRLANSPRYRYDFHSVRRHNGQLVGHFIAKEFIDPSTKTRYVDLIELFPSLGSNLDLLYAAMNALAATDTTISFYPAHSGWEKYATAVGFKASSRHRFLCGFGDPPQNLVVGKLDVDVF